MQKKQGALIVVLVVSVILGQGCKTTVIGTEGETSAVYRYGKLSTKEPKGMNAVYQATEKALADLELSISQKLKDELAAKIIARDSQDQKITIDLLAVTEDSTQLTIQVSPLEKARRIYQKIRDNLQQ
jgi:cytidylate kinase